MTDQPTEQKIEIYQLGIFECYLNGDSVHDSLSRKTRAILSYLASSDETYSRHVLYNIFCQDTEDPAGTLRWHLSRIRRLLNEDILNLDNQHVSFNHDAAYIDSVDFQGALANLSLNSPTLDDLVEKIELYRGEFLSGLNLRNAPEFEFWLSAERTRMAQYYERGLLNVIDQLITLENNAEAINWAQHLLQTNPLLETAHTRLMWLYAAVNQRENAIKQFQRCTDILRRELAVDPSDECKQLCDEIMRGELPHYTNFVSLQTVALTQTQDQKTAFFGRDQELQNLTDLWHTTLNKENCICLIDAEAGGGKTRIVSEFARTLPEHHYLIGNCYESSRHTPYQPWIEILEPYLMQTSDEAISKIDTFWMDQLSYLLPSLALRTSSPAKRAEFNEMHLSIAVLHFLNLIEPKIPLVIVLDNIQWADEASLRLFQFLTRKVHHYERTPLLLIGLYRSEELDDNSALQTLVHDLSLLDSFEKITLPPLNQESVKELIYARWGEIDATPLTERLLNVTGGNPLYLTELLDELDEEHIQGDPSELGIPASLVDLVQRRLQQVSGNERQVIDSMAIINIPVSSYVLQSISGRSEDEVYSAIDAGLRWRLFHAIEDEIPARFTFRHDLIRDAVHYQINAIRRQRLHKRSAEKLMEMGASPAEIAYHWEGAGDKEQEAHYLGLAGKEASRLYANNDAIEYFRRAIDITADPVELADLWMSLGNSLYLLEDWETGDEAYEEALRLSKEQKLQKIEAQLYGLMGRAARYRGQYDAAIEYLKKAEDYFTEFNVEDQLVVTYVSIGSTYLRQADSELGLNYINRALEIANKIGDLKSALLATGTKGEGYIIQGDLDTAIPLFQESLAIASQLDDRRSMGKLLTNLGHCAVQLFNYDDGWNYCAEAAEILYVINDLRPLALAAINMGVIARLQGLYDVSMLCNQYCLKLSLEINDLRIVAISLAELASIDIDLGYYERPERLSQQAIHMAKALNLRYELGQWQTKEIKRLYELDQYQEALAICREAIEVSNAINRNDRISLQLHVFEIRLQKTLEEVDIETAIAALHDLFESTKTDVETAIIHYAIWELDPSQEESQQKASALYKNLYTKNADMKFYDRYFTLTGEKLPKTSTQLELPNFIANVTVDVDHLLEQVDDIIENLTQ